MPGDAALTAGIAGAFFGPLLLALACLIVGWFVILPLIGLYFVDQVLSLPEFVVLLTLAVGAAAAGFAAPSPAWAWCPPLVAVVAWRLLLRSIRRRDETVHAEHLDAQERRALELLERDPRATVGYERLYEIYLAQQRLAEARNVLLQWRTVAPTEPKVHVCLRRVEALLTGQPAAPPAPPPEPAVQPPPRPLVELAGEPEPAPPPPKPRGLPPALVEGGMLDFGPPETSNEEPLSGLPPALEGDQPLDFGPPEDDEDEPLP